MALPRCTLKSFMFVCPRVFYLLKNNSLSAQISFELFLNFHFMEILSFCHTSFRYLQLKFFSLHRFETISRKLFGISPWILIELIVFAGFIQRFAFVVWKSHRLFLPSLHLIWSPGGLYQTVYLCSTSQGGRK